MQSDKAFLPYGGISFIARIAAEASKVSDRVLVVIGDKEKGRFEAHLGTGVTILRDSYHLEAPIGGMLTAFEKLGDGFAAVVGCDSPLIRGEVLGLIFSCAVGHSAAVPLWDSGKVEPLCAVYEASEAREASVKAVAKGKLKCRDMIALLRDVNYVPVSRLRGLDPTLGSLANINTPADLEALQSGLPTRMLPLRAAAALPPDD